ncbi:class I SAM-dependent methyltransferase [Psychromonas sp. Urea-02u-13]|uniref:class I SAM-dependent methyltransferase n=1 Tax=Psychromonas sp. Urea-02u-13 TaxID=2058326 RepID=UPI000C32FF34|nr:SAM-dependent methyltransferase [Psychromonas sp. Urea-02u-13]PKG40915.1 methyltransferase [Psychromonas sp. Urea-02u-13]
MPIIDNVEFDQFLQTFDSAFNDQQLQRLVLSKYKGEETELKRITVRPLLLKGQQLLSFLYEYKTNHITKNLSLSESLEFFKAQVGNHFFNAHLLTDQWEAQLSVSKKAKVLMKKYPNKNKTLQTTETTSHDRAKNRFVEQDRPYLRELGVTDNKGSIIPAMSRKWKQINRFIEVLSRAIDNTGLAKHDKVHIADFGSGKAYLTFAVHDYFVDKLQVKTEVTGVELRQNLVDLCNSTAQKLALEGIKFEQGDVQHFKAQGINIMIALHACDIATDYAIHMGIRTGAEIIMCSPCCHKQIRPQMKSPTTLAPLLQHGIHMGQEAEMVTDGLRALLLEAHGYDTQVFEFISLEHTSKNKMILAQKRKQSRDNSAIIAQIKSIKEFYGIKEHCLEELLAN